MEQPELVGSLHFSEPLLLATPVLIKLPHLQPPCLPTYVQSAVRVRNNSTEWRALGVKATQETITAVSFSTFVWPRGAVSGVF